MFGKDLAWFPIFHVLLKCVCKRWRDVICSKDYVSCKSRMGCCGDWLFVRTEGIGVPWKAYDPEADRWHTIPPIPEFHGRSHFGYSCVSVCNRFLVIGGAYINVPYGFVTSRVFSFDPFSQEWSEVASMSTPRAYFACSVVCGKVYVGGGDSSFRSGHLSDKISSAEVYDPVNDRWDDLPAMPNPRSHCFGISYNSKFYVLNSIYKFSYSDRRMEVFSPCERQWRSHQDEWQNPNVFSSSVFVMNGHLYKFNDLDEDEDEDDVEATLQIWNCETRDWNLVGLVPRVTLAKYRSYNRSSGYHICCLRNELYFIGGKVSKVGEIREDGGVYFQNLLKMRFCNPSVTPFQWVQTRPVPDDDGDHIIACVSLEEGLR